MATQTNPISIQRQLTIANIAIRQDHDGRYCLNDLHKAAGGEQRHQPRYWLANQQAKDLISELSDSGNPLSEQNQPLKVRKGGDGWQGTFAVKDLVYDYAMWISAAFKVKVIRAYDKLMTDPLAGITPLKIGEMFVAAEKARLALEAELAVAAPKAKALDRISTAKGSMCITDAAKALQIQPKNLFDYMEKERWVFRRKPNGPLIAYQDKIDVGYLEHKVSADEREEGSEKLGHQVRITPLGLSVLAQHFSQIVLPLVFVFGDKVIANIQ